MKKYFWYCKWRATIDAYAQQSIDQFAEDGIVEKYAALFNQSLNVKILTQKF